MPAPSSSVTITPAQWQAMRHSATQCVAWLEHFIRDVRCEQLPYLDTMNVALAEAQSLLASIKSAESQPSPKESAPHA